MFKSLEANREDWNEMGVTLGEMSRGDRLFWGRLSSEIPVIQALGGARMPTNREITTDDKLHGFSRSITS